MAQKGDEMMPAISPVNTLEHMTEHTAFADFLCENTQNTWNTYFCKKRLGKAASTADHEERSGGLYTRTRVLCVPRVPARQPMIAICVAGRCTREKSGEHFQSDRLSQSER